jgi:N6-L-threonylcarbamoyladenine synthase
MLVLGIETSCDETAAAIVSDGKDILANVVLSQTAEHLPYGGVVPEIAARAHLDHIKAVLAKAVQDSGVTLSDMDAIAVTGGPGLIGGVIVGVMTAKAIASVHNKPFIAVNHLEGHALTVRLTDDVPFPFLLLLVSGGHCQFLMVENGKKNKYLVVVG